MATTFVVDGARTSDDIWEFWLPRLLRTEFLQEIGADEDTKYVVKGARQAAEVVLGDALVASGFRVPRRKKKRLRVISVASLYGQAGVVLRATHTNWVSQEYVVDPDPLLKAEYPCPWSLSDFAAEPR